MTKSFILLTCAVLALSACQTTPDRVRVEGDGYKVDVNDGSHNNGKCPPGHHMKGWC